MKDRDEKREKKCYETFDRDGRPDMRESEAFIKGKNKRKERFIENKKHKRDDYDNYY